MKLINQLGESLSGFVITSNNRAFVVENETVENRYDVSVNLSWNATLGDANASRIQVYRRNIADRVRKEIDSGLAAAENRIHYNMLTAMDSVNSAMVETTVRLITRVIRVLTEQCS